MGRASLRPIWDSLYLTASLGLAITGGAEVSLAFIKLTSLSEGLVWAVHGGSLKIMKIRESIEGNSSMVEEKVANMTSLEEYINLPPISTMVPLSDNHLPFSLVLLALLEVLCSLLHSRLFSG